ncbi:PAQR family membrane homeostasis protein TrhA [Oricola thermophila]|uniref:Hemolysin III family protein n=1 Tax=Oricola thermophila TaxID=2742145 RepID=A0A6N1VC06_9HYPH|nr:hemolysin III family protein [Oricola thermophila]QKV18410.1 hemolysin III family protein [Oricola thermophila]
MSYPDYTRAERIADGIIHVTGIAASVIAVAMLLVAAVPTLDAFSTTALAVYGVTVVMLFSVSAAYHMVTRDGLKSVLRKFDQAAIFFKIAGTYTPLVVLLGSAFAYGVLVFVWIAAILGALAKFAFDRRLEGITVGIFLVLGWASLTLAWPIFVTLPVIVSVLILSGGILYSVGVIFHLWDGLKFQNAIWHAFVLAASACHFTAVATGTFALA